MATHDLRAVRGPLLYTARPPQDLKVTRTLPRFQSEEGVPLCLSKTHVLMIAAEHFKAESDPAPDRYPKKRNRPCSQLL